MKHGWVIWLFKKSAHSSVRIRIVMPYTIMSHGLINNFKSENLKQSPNNINKLTIIIRSYFDAIPWWVQNSRKIAKTFLHRNIKTWTIEVWDKTMQGTKCPNITTTLKVIMLSNQLATCFSPPPLGPPKAPLSSLWKGHCMPYFHWTKKKFFIWMVQVFACKMGRRSLQLKESILWGGRVGPRGPFEYKPKTQKEKKKLLAAGVL